MRAGPCAGDLGVLKYSTNTQQCPATDGRASRNRHGWRFCGGCVRMDHISWDALGLLNSVTQTRLHTLPSV